MVISKAGCAAMIEKLYGARSEHEAKRDILIREIVDSALTSSRSIKLRDVIYNALRRISDSKLVEIAKEQF